MKNPSALMLSLFLILGLTTICVSCGGGDEDDTGFERFWLEVEQDTSKN